MVRASVTHGEIRNEYTIWFLCLKGRYHTGDFSIRERAKTKMDPRQTG
jgi:hypothetical protein